MAVPNHPVYPTQPRPLRDQIAGLLKKSEVESIEGEIAAVIAPDTNLLKGGEAAASVYNALEGRTYDTVILVSASHVGPFERISVCNLDTYHTALGELNVNDRVRNELCDEDDDIFIDDRGHFHTEGIDVQLPFLQVVLDEPFDIVPIVMGQESPDFCRELGSAIGEVAFNRRVLVVASADIVDADEESLVAFRRHFEAGDVSRLLPLLNSESVMLAGKGPVLAALIAAQHRRAGRVRILTLQPPTDGLPGFLGAVITRI